MSTPHIWVDADACPVIRQVVAAAQTRGLPVTLLCDEHHCIQNDYASVRCIASGADAVDIALINLCRPGDIVVTQDYGVAAMALGKSAYAIHHSGWRYTRENIDSLLMERHLAKKARRASGKHHLHGPAKFTKEDRTRFAEAFEALLDEAQSSSGGIES